MVERSADSFVVAGAKPAYLADVVRRTMADRVAAAQRELACCRACPRDCGSDRSANETKFCGIGRYARVASAGPHFGEEDCLRGSRGSGTIFFARCNLRCVFCQNWDISQRAAGRESDAAALADLMLGLQEEGCHNINLVTPEHVVPQIVEALAVAIDRGLTLPIVYNTSAYDSLASVKLMDGLVDIYMPDFKVWSSRSAKRFLKAKDYPERARDAIREMHRQVGELCFTPDGVACRGVLVRHLVMPGLVEEGREIFRWLAEEVSRDTYVNIMAQYHPEYQVGRKADVTGGGCGIAYEEINRLPEREEIAAAHAAALEAGLWRFDERRGRS
jgi:putative pyruvate formate lyase activating enzyme